MPKFASSGVKYIKIARYDAFGNDNYQSLRQLDNIRIKTVDKGIIDYPVATITEYLSSSLNGPYFLYQIVTTNITSSTNNQILNYRVSASTATSISNISSPTSKIVTTYTENTDNLGYFNNSSGYITFQNTPNIPIIITSSVKFSINTDQMNAGSIPHLSLVDVTDLGAGLTSLSYASQVFPNIVLQIQTGSASSPVAAGTTGTIILTGSFTPIENRSYVLVLSNLNGLSASPPPSWNGTDIDLKITQSIFPQAGIGAQTVLEPYITTPFINSDYNATINNATENRLSTEFMDVDYENNPFVPINRIAILSGSATPASVQDSNYSSLKNISSRYIGKQLQSDKLNVYTDSDISFGKTPNVSNPRSYFVRFNFLAGTLPEWGNNFEGKTNVSIKYIIDENGNEIPPLFDKKGINLSIIQSTFDGYYNPGNNNPVAKAIIQLSNPQVFGVNMDSLNNAVSVFKVGQRIRPIAYTQIASYDSNGNVTGYGYTGSINFVQGDTPNDPGGSANDYRMVTFVPSLNTYTSTFLPNRIVEINDSAVTESFPKEINFNPPIQLGRSASFTVSSGVVNPSTGSIYKPTGSLAQLSGSGYILNFKVFLRVNSSIFNIGGGGHGFTVKFALQKSINKGVSWSDLDDHTQYFPGNTSFWYEEFYLRHTDRSATTSSLYRVAALERGTPVDQYNRPVAIFGSGVIQVEDSSYFQVIQYPASNTGPVTQFWMTGSNSNLLFAKKGNEINTFGLNDVWGQKQQNIENSGFDPIVYDFEPQAGDEIRFGGVEVQSYTITQVSQSVTQLGAGNYNALTLVLDRQISNTINTDYFLIRRYITDPGNIILDISKPAGQTSDGILIPEFLGEKATETKEKIISLLRTQS